MAKKRNGRPPVVIDWNEFEKLCAFHCTQEEILLWFNLTDKTLTRHCKLHYKKSFSEIYKVKRVKGKVSLRRSQMQLANAGNPAMLIFLGKNYLDQSDRGKEEINDQETFNVEVTVRPKVE